MNGIITVLVTVSCAPGYKGQGRRLILRFRAKTCAWMHSEMHSYSMHGLLKKQFCIRVGSGRSSGAPDLLVGTNIDRDWDSFPVLRSKWTGNKEMSAFLGFTMHPKQPRWSCHLYRRGHRPSRVPVSGFYLAAMRVESYQGIVG